MRKIIIYGKEVEVMTVAEAAQYLGITEHAVYSLTTPRHKEVLKKIPKEVMRMHYGKGNPLSVTVESVKEHHANRRRYRPEALRTPIMTQEEREAFPDEMTGYEAAEYIGVSYRTMFRRIQHKDIHNRFNKQRRKWVVSKADLDYVLKHGWNALIELNQKRLDENIDAAINDTLGGEEEYENYEEQEEQEAREE